MAGDGSSPYLYPGTQVLRNKFGIRDPLVLDNLEHEITARRIAELSASPIPGKLDLAHMRAVHHHLFQDLYEWAGEIRTVSISKGSTLFALPGFIEGEGARLHRELERANFFRGLAKTEFVGRLSEHYADWNALHPFREGNGRATREFFSMISRQAGYSMDFRSLRGPSWNLAAAQSIGGQLQGVQDLFMSAVRPLRAEAFELLPREQALQAHPELAPSFAALDETRAGLQRVYRQNPEKLDAAMRRAVDLVQQGLNAGRLVATPAPALDVDRQVEPAIPPKRRR